MQDYRRLAAIMFTDMAGFSALTQRNEALALDVLSEHWQLLRSVFPQYGGKEIRSMGDGVFVEFASALDAVRCAIRLQEMLHEHNSTVGTERQILIRIGLHLGDVVESAAGVHGDGVNIAARIEPLAAPGGVCVSEDVARQVQNKIDLPLQKLGLGELKNISLPVTIYKIILPWEKRLRLDHFYFPFRRRKVKVWALITGIASLLVAVYIGLRLVAPVSQPPMQRLGVLRFQSLPPESAAAHLGMTLQSMFAEQFIGIEGLGVVDPLSLNNFIDSSYPKHDVELLKALSTAQLSLVIDGSITANVGGGYSIQAKLVDPATGAVTVTQSATIAGEDDLPQAVNALSGRILGFLQLRQSQGEKDKDLRPWIAHKSQNLEAVKAFIQASQFIYRGEPGEEKYLRRAVELDSLFVPARIWLISGMVRRRELAQAQEQYAFLRNIESTMNPFDATMTEWAFAYIHNDVPAQARALSRALEYSPGNNILLYNLGRVRFIMEDYRGAIEPLTEALAMKWPFSAAYYLTADSHYKLGEFDAAREVLASAIGIQPVYRDIYALLSLLSLQDNDTTTATRYENRYIWRSVELGHPEAAAYASLGNVSRSHGFPANAVRLFRRATTLEPGAATYHASLGNALMNMGNAREAAEECLRAVQLDSTLGDAQFILGRVYDSTGDTTRALMHYRLFLRLDSTSDDAVLARGRLQRLSQTR